MSKFTALHPNSELNIHFNALTARNPRDVQPYLIHTDTVEDITRIADYERVKFWDMQSAESDSEGNGKIIADQELLLIAGGYMAGDYQGALEFSELQSLWLLRSPEFSIFMGDDLQAKADLMALLTAV